MRIRLIGGKTLRWGRASWRMSNFEFKGKDHDGFGDNWPLSYEDLAPYYDRVEPMFRVAGRKEGLPQLPDGVFLEDNSRDSLSVERFIAAAKAQTVPTTKQRRATGTLASSVNLLLPDAIATGNLRIVPNAVVREITADKNTGWSTACTSSTGNRSANILRRRAWWWWGRPVWKARGCC